MSNFDINDLTFDNIGSWPFAVRMTVIAIVSAALIFAGFWFDTRKQMQSLKKHERQEFKLRTTFETKAQQAANYDAYLKQLVQIKAILSDLLEQLPGKTEVPALLEDISAIGHEHGLRFRLFKPMPELLKEFYAEMPIKMSVQGNYHQISQFISEVSKLDRIVTVDKFKIKTRDSKSKRRKSKDKNLEKVGELRMDLIAKTYRYQEEIVKNGKNAKR